MSHNVAREMLLRIVRHKDVALSAVGEVVSAKFSHSSANHVISAVLWRRSRLAPFPLVKYVGSNRSQADIY